MRAALCHHCDVMNIRLSIDGFLYVINRNQTRISLSFHDVITDVITPAETIREDPIDIQHRKPLC